MDRYDWELGLNVTLGEETVKDEDMKLIEVYKGAKPFEINYPFTQSINSTINL